MCVIEFYFVERKKHKHRMRADTLVPINKSVVLHKPITKTSCFLLNGRIYLLVFVAMKRCF